MIFSLGRVLAISALVGLGAAAPAQLTSRDVSADVLKQLNLFAEYSAAAYCTTNIDSPGDKLTCEAGNCPSVEKAETETLSEFFANDEYGDVAGFFAVDSTNKLLILSFRGSRTIDNWIANLDFGLDKVEDLCAGCQAHGGFYKAWQAVADDITASVKSAVDKYSGYKLVFTGHSFGAALASFAATALRNDGFEIDLYSYGSPRLGNKALATYITGQGTNYRITHTNDIVPRLPPSILGFTHFSPEYWITSANQKTVTGADITLVEGVGSRDGNAGEAKQSVLAHSWYFVSIFACA
ncbi:alpha/beta-hydrolase [Aspergillus steynii IBT 23096]|uniref:feruloyl esterase n=1 Tax=Aspergillus steynii IBT 23096 TaxID=1392250 RepID=A0A2I2GGZ1_9EURO|nr:alpha/beta-hydrolase [Aspergillus steynii IBT 23096]PLB52143.1 alpha/beta-hydrolase [Aspergillus steynii IBT 23096]